MPVHDWTNVPAGAFHSHHQAWITQLYTALNQGVLPDGYYAFSEPTTSGVFIPDLLALQSAPPNRVQPASQPRGVALAAPAARLIAHASLPQNRLRRIAIRHQSGDNVVAFIEIVSPGNLSSRESVHQFVRKAIAAFREGIHFMVIDILPPTSAARFGMHGAIWRALNGAFYRPSSAEPLTVASYRSNGDVTAFIEPSAVGHRLPDLPLFLSPDLHVSTPLESTYLAALAGSPRHVRVALGESV